MSTDKGRLNPPPLGRAKSDLELYEDEIDQGMATTEAEKTTDLDAMEAEFATLDSDHDAAPKETFVSGDAEHHYELMDELGMGQFATVHKARNKLTDGVVAVKVIDRSEPGAGLISVTYKEIDAMLRIDHPNCVRLHEIFQTDDRVQLVMELVEGGGMFDAIQARKIEESDVRQIMQQICEGAQHLHSQRIIQNP